MLPPPAKHTVGVQYGLLEVVARRLPLRDPRGLALETGSRQKAIDGGGREGVEDAEEPPASAYDQAPRRVFDRVGDRLRRDARVVHGREALRLEAQLRAGVLEEWGVEGGGDDLGHHHRHLLAAQLYAQRLQQALYREIGRAS